MVNPLYTVSLRQEEVQPTVLQLDPEMGHSDLMEEEKAGWRLTGYVIRGRQEVGYDRSRLAVWCASCQERESTKGEFASLTHSTDISLFSLFMPNWVGRCTEVVIWICTCSQHKC